jgi:hypothetical protein
LTTRDGFQAAAQGIRAVAAKWDVQAPKVGGIVDQVETLRFHDYDPGLFKPAIDAHEKVIQKVADRCTEAHGVFLRIAQTLHGIASVYEQLDSASADRIKALTTPAAPTTKILR